MSGICFLSNGITQKCPGVGCVILLAKLLFRSFFLPKEHDRRPWGRSTGRTKIFSES